MTSSSDWTQAFFVQEDEGEREKQLEALRETQFQLSFWGNGSVRWVDVDALSLQDFKWMKKRIPEELEKIRKARGKGPKGRHG